MEIIKRFDQEEVERIMTERGYDQVSVNMNKDVISSINFVKRTDLGVGFHAQVHMKNHMIEITMVQLRFMCHLRTGFFDFFHPQFEKYEKIMYLYTEACLNVDDIFNKAETMTGVSSVIPSAPVKQSSSSTEEKPKKEKKTIQERKLEFWGQITPIAKQKKLTKEFTLEFYKYWTEHGPNDKTFRREREKVFDISRRLDTFVKNEKKWSKTAIFEIKAEKQNAAIKEVKEMPNHKDLF